MLRLKTPHRSTPLAACSVTTVVLIALGMSPAARAADNAVESKAPFPAAVKVAAAHTYLRAGPSDDFYPTERIGHGQAVEVWSVDTEGSGYCAVRPVAGSFSWIRAADVDEEARLGEQPANVPTAAARGSYTGVIVADGAVSRIGSQLNDLRHVAQVSLEAGERVEVIDQVRIAAGRHAGLWARIEPPAGEFRWARLADLELSPELAALVPQPGIAAERATGASAAEAAVAIKEAGEAIALAVNEAREAAVPEPTAAIDPPTLEPVPLSKRLFSGWLPMGTGVFDAAPRPGPVAATSGGAAGVTDELADIDLALSLAVAGPNEQWNLVQLRERLRLAAAQTNTQSERLRAEAIDARLTRFEAIQNRQQALAVNVPADPSPLRLGSMWSSLSGVGSRPIRPGVFPGGVPADGQPTWTPPNVMETTGRLATVVSRRPDAPRWAIVDDNNSVLAFVAPQTGVNLAPLVGQQVSVRGAQGYMPEYKRPYLVAAEARPRIAVVPAVSGDTTR
ncbi:MAG: hypothetical protein WCH77_04690 [Planctomycetota bacterium]